MNGVVRLALFGLLFYSCSSTPKDRIVEGSSAPISYANILNQLAEAHEEEPDNELIIRQQLYYCEELGWPVECGTPLLAGKERWGLSRSLTKKFTAYYLINDRYEELLNLLANVPETRELSEVKFQAYYKMGRKTQLINDLNTYLRLYEDEQAHRLAANYYLKMERRNEAIAELAYLWSVNTRDTLFHQYYPLLIEEKRYGQADTVIQALLSMDTSLQLLRNFAWVRYELGERRLAKGILRKQVQQDTACRQLVLWYTNEEKVDSAIVYQKYLVDRYPNQTADLLYLATLYESKGWITNAYNYLQRAALLDTANLALQEKVQAVGRKVAYLRFLKERDNKVPILNLQKKNTLDE